MSATSDCDLAKRSVPSQQAVPLPQRKPRQKGMKRGTKRKRKASKSSTQPPPAPKRCISVPHDVRNHNNSCFVSNYKVNVADPWKELSVYL